MTSDMDVEYFIYDEGEYNQKWYQTYEWYQICEKCPLESLLKHEKYVDWEAASGNCNLSIDLIEKYKDQIDFERIARWCDKSIMKAFTEELKDYVTFKDFKKNEISDNAVERFIYIESQDNLFWNKSYEWSDICERCSSYVLYKYEDEVNWKAASFNKNLPSDLIESHKDEVDFYEIFQWANEDILYIYSDKFKGFEKREEEHDSEDSSDEFRYGNYQCDDDSLEFGSEDEI